MRRHAVVSILATVVALVGILGGAGLQQRRLLLGVVGHARRGALGCWWLAGRHGRVVHVWMGLVHRVVAGDAGRRPRDGVNGQGRRRCLGAVGGGGRGEGGLRPCEGTV